MKKNIYLFAGALTLLFVLNSCSKKNELEDKTLKFSTLTVEQQKQSIEKNGIDLADRMEGLQKTQGFVALTQFANISGAMGAPMAKLRVNLLRNDVKALETFNNQMRVASSNFGDSIWGEWTWNENSNDFQKTGTLTNKAILHFPADSLATTNNATLTIIYVESTVKIPNVDPVQYMPKSLSVILMVGTSQALNAQFEGTYNADATPTFFKQTLVVGAYNWSATLTNTSADVSANYTFKYNTEILMKYDVGAKGSFTANQIEAVINDSTNSNGPQDIVTSGFMSLQVMNIVVYGGITDTKGFMNEGNALKPDSVVHHDDYYNYDYTEYIYGKSYYDKEVSIFNKYLKFYGYFAAENTKFADIEFYTAEKTEEYYDYNTYPYQFKTRTVYNAQPRLVLSDGSKVTDLKAYANENFKTVIDRFVAMQP